MERIAIIDLGSNTARLLLVDVSENGYFQIVDQLKEAPRLGEGMERDGFLKPARIHETINTLKMFRKLCDVNGIERIIAVATAAVRRAKNQRSFLDEVSSTCGIKLKVLSAEEEALLVYRGVINTMDISKGLILEIGGGSTKIVYYNRRNLLNYETLPFGAITLTELFSGEGVSPQEQAEKIENFFTEQLKKIEWLKDVDPEVQMIGVGGSFRNLCRMTKIMKKYSLKTIHNYVLNDNDFDKIKTFLRSANGNVMIAGGERDVKAFKEATRITEDGGKEVFRDTDESATPKKEYAPEESKFIRSLILLFLIIAAAAAGFMYFKKNQKQLNRKFNTVVEQTKSAARETQQVIKKESKNIQKTIILKVSKMRLKLLIKL